MAKNTSVILGDHFEAFVGEQVSEGRYGSASDVIRAGLRLLEEQEAKRQLLISALIEGENSGPAKPLNFEEFIGEMRAEYEDQ